MAATPAVVDMSKVKERGDFNPKQLPDGDYLAKVTKVVDHKSKAGNKSWLYTISITSPKGKGATYPYYCGVDADQLWKVRNLFVAAGLNVPKKKVRLDPNKAVGRAIGVTLEEDEPYNGKIKSVIASVMPVSEVGDAEDDADEDDEEADEEDVEETEEEDDEEEDEEPAPKAKKGKKSKKPVDDDEDLEELEVEDI